jgi:hypothetical protein
MAYIKLPDSDRILILDFIAIIANAISPVSEYDSFHSKHGGKLDWLPYLMLVPKRHPDVFQKFEDYIQETRCRRRGPFTECRYHLDYLDVHTLACMFRPGSLMPPSFETDSGLKLYEHYAAAFNQYMTIEKEGGGFNWFIRVQSSIYL